MSTNQSQYTTGTEDQDSFAADTYDGAYADQDQSRYDDGTYDNSQYDNTQYDNSQYDNTQYEDGTYGDSQYDTSQGDSQYDQSQYDQSQYDQSQYDQSQQEPYSDQPSSSRDSYSDQPYTPSQDTGDAMMAYDENQAYDDQAYDQPDEDYDYDGAMGEYDENQEEEPYYDEDDPLYEPRMPADYYAEEQYQDDYDEEEEERLRRSRRRRAWCCCLILLCCLLILIILLIIFLLSMQEDNRKSQTDAPTFSPFVDSTDDDYYYDDDIIIAPGVVTSKMAPYDYDCDYDDQEGFPNVFDQCKCDGEITIVPEDVAEMRDLIITRMFNKIYQNRTALPLESCDPSNMALIWLASGDNRDAGEVRQRFALGMVFFQLNGTIWDYTDEWLSDLNECLWLGVQCNNRDAVNSLALDTNNIFGPVCTVLYSTRNKEHRAVLHCVQRGIIHSQFSLFLFF
jgi:hypothetical protein